MAATRWVRPAPHHARVRDPRNPSSFFPSEGVEVPAHDFAVERLVLDGDLVECDPPAAEAEADAPAAEEKGA